MKVELKSYCIAVAYIDLNKKEWISKLFLQRNKMPEKKHSFIHFYQTNKAYTFF